MNDRQKGTLRCMDSYLRCICASRPLTRPWNDRACLLTSSSPLRKSEQGEHRWPLHSYLGSWVKAWKPAFEATNRRIAWKWLSSSALSAGSSVSWDKSARMALLMSFSLFSEKRPWGKKWERQSQVWELVRKTDGKKITQDLNTLTSCVTAWSTPL